MYSEDYLFKKRRLAKLCDFILFIYFRFFCFTDAGATRSTMILLKSILDMKVREASRLQ